MPAPVTRTWHWIRLLSGLVFIFALFHGLASVLDSDRGQAGLLVGGFVLIAAVAAERLLFNRPLSVGLRDLGLGPPRAIGLVAAILVVAVLACAGAVVLRAIGAQAALVAGWSSLVPGLFAQAGVAEETLFRGYLYGHIREGRSFRRAATLSAAPFVAVHFVLFATMPWPVAIASVVLALILSFPLAHVYELGGDTIWAPALLHFAIQAGAKLPKLFDNQLLVFSLLWMFASAATAQLLFLIPRDRA